jgi:hypothetical protein
MSFPKRRKGQTLLEFVFVLVLFIFMLSITYNAVVAFSLQQYMSYAAFMGARAYQAGSIDAASNLVQAQATLNRFIPGIASAGTGLVAEMDELRFGMKLMAKRIKVKYPDAPSPTSGLPLDGNAATAGSAEKGLVITFEAPFAIVPIGLSQSLSFLKMKVISNLGREVSVSECKGFFTAIPNAGPFASFLEDTGC